MVTFKELWYRVHEPRIVTAIQTFVYLILLTAGIFALLQPPNSINDTLGPVMMTVSGALLLIGGAIAMVGTPGGFWWAERIGIWGLLGGSGSYLTAIIYLQFTNGGNRVFQALFILAFMLELVKRMVRISGLEYDPEKDAKRLYAGE